MVFAGDGDWKDETVTTLSDIRNKAIDEFAEQLKLLSSDGLIRIWNERQQVGKFILQQSV